MAAVTSTILVFVVALFVALFPRATAELLATHRGSNKQPLIRPTIHLHGGVLFPARVSHLLPEVKNKYHP